MAKIRNFDSFGGSINVKFVTGERTSPVTNFTLPVSE